MEQANILVVDDEKEIRDLVGIYLRNEGYEVILAGTGLEALKVIGEQEVHLIVLDIMEEPDVLLLDEPTNGLDDSGVDEIRKLISAQAKRGAIVCVASHNKEDIALLSDKIFRVDNGAVREE